MRRTALLLLAVGASSCGYHLAGQADLIPKEIHTIAIPAFANSTTRYKITDRLPEAISREFISRTRYKIVSDPNAADMVLRATVLNYISSTTIIDPTTNRASGVELRVIMQVNVTERATGKVLFSRPNFDFRERYQISTEPASYFEESDAALNRVSQQVARELVSSILENF